MSQTGGEEDGGRVEEGADLLANNLLGLLHAMAGSGDLMAHLYLSLPTGEGIK